MKWFKFYGEEYLSDPKMLSLSPAERSCWLTLLCYASQNEKGIIKYLTEDILMTQSGLDFQHEEWEETKGILEKFKKLKMITNDNEMIQIINWDKRQGSNLTNYERVKKWRIKNRNDNKIPIINDNAMITLDKIRVDKNINSGDIATSPKSPHQEIIDFYYDAYKQQEGVSYVVSGGDAKAVKEALTTKQMSPQEIKSLFRWYLERPDFKKFPTMKTALSGHFINLYRQSESDE